MNDAHRPETLLGGLSPAEFLREYWQKRPLLVRGAFPGLRPPLSPEELAGLACEEGAAARLVLERGGRRPWELRHGPFDEEEFTRLPPSHWTLLVNDVEKHLPSLYALIEPFRFIPDWRIDDLMISYAVPEGSVGPHVDDYDVFLIQLHGRRRWQITHRPIFEEALIEGPELRILRRFAPDESWVLEPGDMLYLPPRIGHHGVAVDACMTASVGFRAPSHRELLSAFLEWRVAELDPALRYADADLQPQANPAEIAPGTLARVGEILRRELSLDPDGLLRWLGRYLTEPKAELHELYVENPAYAPRELLAALAAGPALARSPAARLAFAEGEDRLWCYADGEAYPLPKALRPAVEHLCAERAPRAELLLEACAAREFLDLLHALWERGILYFEHE